VSESKKNLDPSDPAYYAPPRSRDRANVPAPSDKDRQALSVSRGLEEQLARLRTAQNSNLPTAQSDVFADAVARMLREQMNNGDTPSILKRRSSAHLAAKLAVAVVGAALVALAYVLFLSPPQDGDDVWSALRPGQSAKSSIPSSAPHRVSALIVRNHAGPVNQPLELGVSVDSPDAGATVTIKGMPPGARLTAGVPLSFTEWRVPAEEVSNVMVIPPADFAGELDLSAELRSPEGTAQVTSFMQLVWRAAPPPATVLATSNAVMTSTVQAPPPQQPPPQLQQPQLQQAVALPPQPAPQQPAPQVQPPPQTVAALPAASAPAQEPQAQQPQARADTVRELSPNEIAALIRRAQEMLANGDIKAGRLLLLHAAGARDARAALALAKTYDPIALRQFSSAELGPDLAQARNWYQKAREWGAPEAQRQLDALASYPLR
jgi:hypothetical protein